MIKWFKLRPGTQVSIVGNPPSAFKDYRGQVGTVVSRGLGPYSVLVEVDYFGPIDLHFPLSALEIIK